MGVTMTEMVEQLSEKNLELLRDKTQCIVIFADGGEEKVSHWFEIWHLRGNKKPPRKIFASAQQYSNMEDAVESGIHLLERIRN